MQFAEIRDFPGGIRGLFPAMSANAALAMGGGFRYTGGMMDYEIIRSRRRTLALEITREGRLQVRAPSQAPDTAIQAFVQAHEGRARAHLAKVRERLAASPPPQSREDIAALKAKAKAVLPGKIARYAAILGVEPTGFRVTEARTRYGSCGAKNSLSFSCFLMLCPEEAIDLVVVHELCHIRHHDHSPAFYALLASVLPDHRERRKLLRMPREA